MCPGSLQFWILTFCTPLTVNMFIFIGLSSCLSAAEGGSSIVLEVLLAGGFSIILFLFFPSCIKQEQQPNIRKRHVYLYDKRNFSLYTFLGKIYGPFIDTASGGITESVLSTLESSQILNNYIYVPIIIFIASFEAFRNNFREIPENERIAVI